MKEKGGYFERAESWAVDAQVLAARSRRVAWIVAAIAVAVALFEAVALALLMPLKTVQPVTLLVDRQTGYVQALEPLAVPRISGNAALTQSFLAQYVMAREGFDRSLVAADYRKVALWSADKARSDYVSIMPATNPNSPFQRYSAGTFAVVRVKSVSPLSPNTALVRFDTQRQDRNGRADPPQPWISVVRYRYVDAPMSLEDRLVNPLGFQVWSYRRDAEAPPPPSLSAGAATAAQPAMASPMIDASPRVGMPPQPYETVPQRRTIRTDRPMANEAEAPPTMQRREVPWNRVPMGSPLAGPPR